jgi:hypothetical protein
MLDRYILTHVVVEFPLVSRGGSAADKAITELKPETGHYFLHDNEYKSHVYLQGDDTRIFRKEIERIDELPDPEYKNGLLTENAIKFYL